MYQKEYNKKRDRSKYKISKQKSRENNLKYQYNLTLEEYNFLLEHQNYKCAICFCNLKELETKKIHIDHNHITKEIRGILCHNCNIAIGHLKDDVEILNNAIKYLNQFIEGN